MVVVYCKGSKKEDTWGLHKQNLYNEHTKHNDYKRYKNIKGLGPQVA